jgi:5,10-methylenetetrahydromethanopterin reductase
MAVPRIVTWGVGCWQTPVLTELTADVEAAEDASFDFLWYGNEKLHPDMWVGLTAAALHSRTLRLGTFVADPFWLHPAITAAMLATLDAYSDGRAVLVLGAGGSGLRELGLERRKPVEAIERAVSAIRALLHGEQVAQAKLHFPARPDIPIWIASRGERVLELGGRIADGVMIGTIARPQDIAWAIERIRSGAAGANRSLDKLIISTRVDVVVDADRAAARDALRSFVAGVLSASYPDRGFVERAGLTLPEELEAVCRTKDLRLAWGSARLVPDEVVDALTWAGTPDDVAARITAAIDLGVGNITVVFHRTAGSTAQQLRGFAASVMPRVNALLGQHGRTQVVPTGHRSSVGPGPCARPPCAEKTNAAGHRDPALPVAKDAP